MSSGIFDGLVFVIHLPSESAKVKNELTKQIKSCGGTVSIGVGKQTTHLVTSLKEINDGSFKVKEATKHGCFVVLPSFIFDSIQCNQRAYEWDHMMFDGRRLTETVYDPEELILNRVSLALHNISAVAMMTNSPISSLKLGNHNIAAICTYIIDRRGQDDVLESASSVPELVDSAFQAMDFAVENDQTEDDEPQEHAHHEYNRPQTSEHSSFTSSTRTKFTVSKPRTTRIGFTSSYFRKDKKKETTLHVVRFENSFETPEDAEAETLFGKDEEAGENPWTTLPSTKELLKNRSKAFLENAQKKRQERLEKLQKKEEERKVKEAAAAKRAAEKLAELEALRLKHQQKLEEYQNQPLTNLFTTSLTTEPAVEDQYVNETTYEQRREMEAQRQKEAKKIERKQTHRERVLARAAELKRQRRIEADERRKKKLEYERRKQEHKEELERAKEVARIEYQQRHERKKQRALKGLPEPEPTYDQTKLFIGGVTFEDLDKMPKLAPDQKMRIKQERIKHLLSIFDQFGKVVKTKEFFMTKKHAFVAYKDVFDFERALSTLGSYEERKRICNEIKAKIIAEKGRDAALNAPTPHFYVRRVNAATQDKKKKKQDNNNNKPGAQVTK